MAIFSQERHVELVAGANEAFVVTNLMVSADLPGELPHVSVFVLSVADVDDPKQDKLVRVANIADLTTVPIGRDAGIAAAEPNGILYLSASATVSYDTLEVANDAATTFQDRVNALIKGWILFRGEFHAPDPTPALYTFPRGDATRKESLIAAYKAAKQTRYQLQLDKVAADAALTRAEAAHLAAQGLATGMDVIAGKAAANVSALSNVKAALDSLLASGQTFYAAASGTPPSSSDKGAFQAALTVATTQQAAAVEYLSDAAALAAAVVAYQAGRVGDVATAAGTLAAVQTSQIMKVQQLAAAQAAETAALQAVLAICPDFDRRSIPLVDDTGL